MNRVGQEVTTEYLTVAGVTDVAAGYGAAVPDPHRPGMFIEPGTRYGRAGCWAATSSRT